MAMPASQPGWIARLAFPAWTLGVRELVRFFRQRTRVVGALGQPILLWVLFGAGLGGSFRPSADGGPAASFQEFFFPGVAVMIVLFTAIFSTISIIEDRREGFLQGVLASPAPRLSLVLGKLWGGAALAVLQAALFLLLGPLLAFLGLAPPMTTGLTWSNAPAALGVLTLIALSLTALGYLIAWPLDSTQGFHALMSVLLMPMWLLSGAFFPLASDGWLAWVMRCNPLSYGVAALRHVLATDAAATSLPGLPPLATSLVVTVAFGLVCVAADVWLTRRVTHSSAT